MTGEDLVILTGPFVCIGSTIGSTGSTDRFNAAQGVNTVTGLCSGLLNVPKNDLSSEWIKHEYNSHHKCIIINTELSVKLADKENSEREMTWDTIPSCICMNLIKKLLMH